MLPSLSLCWPQCLCLDASKSDVQQQPSTSANAALISSKNNVKQQLSTSANGVFVSIKSDILQQPSTSANAVPVSSQPDVQQQPSAEETDVACHPPTKKTEATNQVAHSAVAADLLTGAIRCTPRTSEISTRTTSARSFHHESFFGLDGEK